MKNEEKIREILNCENCKKQLFIGNVKCPPECTNFIDLMKMAEWKDEQYKQILLVIYSKTLSIEKDVVIEQVYKKLFGEDLDRNELEKDELKNILEKIKKY